METKKRRGALLAIGIVIAMTGLGIFLFSYFQDMIFLHKEERAIRVTKIEVGQTYKYGGDSYIKFIDEKHYVFFVDSARY